MKDFVLMALLLIASVVLAKEVPAPKPVPSAPPVAASPKAPVATSDVFSRTVGSVDGASFTSRQTLLSMAVGHAMQEKSNDPLSVQPRLSDVSALLLDEALTREAGSFGLAETDAAEKNKVVSATQKLIAGKDVLKNAEFSSEEIQSMAARRLVASKLIEMRSETMRGTVSDHEAQMYFEKNRVKFGTLPFESFKENIKKYLSEQQQEQRLRSWFEILRRKYKIKEDSRAVE